VRANIAIYSNSELRYKKAGILVPANSGAPVKCSLKWTDKSTLQKLHINMTNVKEALVHIVHQEIQAHLNPYPKHSTVKIFIS